MDACLTHRTITVIALAIIAGWQNTFASDHADPIDPLNRVQQEGGITDLFVFPVLKDESPAHPWRGNATIPLNAPLSETARSMMTVEQQQDIDSLVFILCVRRALTDTGTLNLEPYTYRIHIDTNHPMTFAQSDESKTSAGTGGGLGGYDDGHAHGPVGAEGRPTAHEAFLRYGGQIDHPEKISEEIIIEFQLTGKGRFRNGFPKYLNRKGNPLNEWSGEVIKTASGVYDDPFIFPAFFGTNVVAMAVKIPITAFAEQPKDFLVWATSHRGKAQIDHQGRSLRTQNPRFELLNTLHPSEHVRAVVDEHTNPGLLRDVALRLNLAQTFAYRKWDFTPDVLIYTTRYPVGFPNGRLLTDDVAALLAQWGDTLLFELSHQHNNSKWPRQNMNDKNEGVFKAAFPYLLEPHPEKPQAPPLRLSMASILKLVAIAIGLLLLLLLENILFAWLWCRWKARKARKAMLL
ncbi:MAG: hypothetical protein U0996_25715 [Planctomycetaceae bacterium]